MTSLARVAVLALAVTSGLAAGCASSSRSREPDSRGLVTSADLENPNEPIEQVLQRKVPGLIVRRTADGGIALQIRGSSSFTGAPTPPLYIVNGARFHPGTDGALTGINPHDIESIRVLTAAQAGLYGIDGANGVIEVTTKMPGRATPRSSPRRTPR